MDKLWAATCRDGLPFWALAWPAGRGLSRYLLDNKRLFKGKRVLDIASGSGLVALAALKAGAANVLAADTDPNAEEAILRNATANGELKHLSPSQPLPRLKQSILAQAESSVCHRIRWATAVNRCRLDGRHRASSLGCRFSCRHFLRGANGIPLRRLSRGRGSRRMRRLLRRRWSQARHLAIAQSSWQDTQPTRSTQRRYGPEPGQRGITVVADLQLPTDEAVEGSAIRCCKVFRVNPGHPLILTHPSGIANAPPRAAV